ncbi:MAG: transcriptional repressor LexA [Melioribacteraceae bacterium]|nr:transcriptional repressor LexA [Melioribacteraceae bacterium]MCO6474017.1 transcriptional repressor LexA [Melioribacteraceae bacterium]MDD3559303.1 transcriptional repressor LexA [Melioribacteraceae bacterium]
MSRELTDRQKEILEFIESYLELNGYPPTYREIGKHFNISSTFGVKRHIDALIKKGYLSSERNSSRVLSLVNAEKMLEKQSNSNSVEIPVVGRVAAGYPIFAQENIEGILNIDSSLVYGRDKVFALKVQGDSMINAGILEGDLVIVKQQKEAKEGEIIIALLGDESTVKRFSQPDDSKINLIPENEKYNVIEVKDSDDFSVVGKVIGVFRHYN